MIERLDGKNLFRANPFLKKEGVQLNYTQAQLENFVRYSRSPIDFVEENFKIVNLDAGLMNIKLYEYQKRAIDTIHKNKFTIFKQPRQSAKTTTMVSYILWATIFNDYFTVAILANKGSLAREILARYQLAYENLPPYLQQGVVEFNKGSVELENGSRIVAGSTSSSSIRGSSYKMVFVDELAHVQTGMAEEFLTSVFPTISSGKDTKLVIASTPKGLNSFYKYWTEALSGKNGFTPFEVKWYDVPGRDEAWYKSTIDTVGVQVFKQEFECEFLGSTNTLVSGEKLSTLVYGSELKRMNDVIIYEEPVLDGIDEDTSKMTIEHIYVICVDISEGKNMDYSAFSVIDISTVPYKQVAIYRNNSIPPILFPTIIKNCAEYYNHAHVLFEVNNNPQVALILAEELGYSNVFWVSSGNKQQQTITFSGGRTVLPGVRMSPLVKRQGCSMLKTMIENDKILIMDFETISELTTFVQQGNTYRAEDNRHDDLVMTLVIFGWLTTQKTFKDMLEHDLRKQLQYEHFDISDEEVSGIGFLNDGLNDGSFVEDGVIWHEHNPIKDFMF